MLCCWWHHVPPPRNCLVSQCFTYNVFHRDGKGLLLGRLGIWMSTSVLARTWRLHIRDKSSGPELLPMDNCVFSHDKVLCADAAGHFTERQMLASTVSQTCHHWIWVFGAWWRIRCSRPTRWHRCAQTSLRQPARCSVRRHLATELFLKECGQCLFASGGHFELHGSSSNAQDMEGALGFMIGTHLHM